MVGCVWLIAGPTASGKSRLALSLAEEVGGEIVNADSMQLYADLRILSARPSDADMARAPHHLYGVADAADGWSAGRWARAAVEVMDDIAGRGRIAIVVGGTGLYFRALTRGLADIPDIPRQTRGDVEALWAEGGEAAVRGALRAGDPEGESRIETGDRQRLLRALEVVQATGKPLGDWQKETSPGLTRPWRALVLEPDRATLYARCDRRLIAMVEAGAIEEARALLSRRLDPSLPVMKAVGMREFGRHLDGETALDVAVAEAQQGTRNYAKRQLTWFRHQTADWPQLPDVDVGAARRMLDT